MINKGIAAIMVNQHWDTRVSYLGKFHLLKLLRGGFFLLYHYMLTLPLSTALWMLIIIKIKDLND